MKRPAYRDWLTTGIVHFGPGAFHRAHQADFVDRVLDEDPRWGIAAVSLRTAATVDALRRQDGLYTLAVLDAETSFRTIGAHSRFIGPSDAAAIRGQLLDPAVKIVTSTVTEKGYCLNSNGSLDLTHPDIERDLARLDSPISLIGWLTLGLADRRRESLAPFTPICCDNLASNGTKLQKAVIAFARKIDPELAQWIDGEVRFPDTVVDSITPASDERLRQLVRERIGVDDEVPVAREAFAQWVIEDILPRGSPDLAGAGATLSSNLRAWERAKLRILNGAHSTLAYLGLLLGRETVAACMSDPLLSSFAQRLVAEDIIPTLQPSPIDLDRYAEETFARFRNPAIGHKLSQIAWDGSQKLPYRLLDTIGDALADGRPVARLAIPIAAWILFVERQARAGETIVDPLAECLAGLARSNDPVENILGLTQVFPHNLVSDPSFSNAVRHAAVQIRGRGVAATITPETVGA